MGDVWVDELSWFLNSGEGPPSATGVTINAAMGVVGSGDPEARITDALMRATTKRRILRKSWNTVQHKSRGVLTIYYCHNQRTLHPRAAAVWGRLAPVVARLIGADDIAKAVSNPSQYQRELREAEHSVARAHEEWYEACGAQMLLS